MTRRCPTRPAAGRFAALSVLFIAATPAAAVEITVPGDFPTITAAIGAASNGDEIVVSPGSYSEAINFGGKDLVVRSLFGPAFTTIDASGTGQSAVTIGAGEPATVRLRGFTVTGGSDLLGGGLVVSGGAAPRIEDCVFTGNTAERGGGIYVGAATAVIINCTASENETTNRGGGLAAFLSATVVVYDSTFADNESIGDGAGVVVHGSSGFFYNCIVRDNVCTTGAGGGLACVEAGSLTCVNGTIVNNTASAGGGVFNAATLTYRNTVSWFNTPDEILIGVPGTVDATYSNIAGGYAGTGNLDLDPLFLDAGASDLRLTSLSPCIDSGSNLVLPTDLLDLDGDGNTNETTPFDRLGQGRRFDAPDQPDTGAGSAPIVDIGAIEFRGDQFEPPAEFAASGEGISEVAGDFDGDGDVDLAIIIRSDPPGAAGSGQVFLNDGLDVDGDWAGFTALAPFAVGVDPSGIDAGFLDDDGTLDLAVVNRGDDTLRLYVNPAGNALFVPGTITSTGTAPSAVVVAELGGPATSEIVVANAGDDTVTVFERGAAPGAAVFVERFTAPVGVEPVALDPEDLDEDRDTDIVVANRGSDSVIALEFQGGSVKGSTESPTGDAPVDVDAGDLDGDGLADVVTANSGDASVSALLGDGSGGFTGGAEAVGTNPESVDLADVDGDGDADIAVVAEDADIGPACQVLKNESTSGMSTFDPPVSYAVEDDPDLDAQPNFVVSADLDGDGLDDLITVNGDDSSSGGSVSALISEPDCPGDADGDGVTGFGDLLAILAAWGPCPAPPASCPADLDGDGTVGFPDLLIALGAWGGC